MGLRKFAPGKAVLNSISLQAEYIVQAAEILSQIGAADRNTRVELNQKLHEIENLADDANHDVLRKVGKSFVLPYDREDMHELISLIDDVIDLIDEAGDNTVLYRIGHLPEKAIELIEIIRQCAELTRDAMADLSSIDESTREYWVAINQLENQGDTTYRSLIADLFNGDNVDAMEVLKIKFVVDALEAAIDSFENLANVVESIAIKES